MIIKAYRMFSDPCLIYEGTNYKEAKRKAFGPLKQIGLTEKNYKTPIITTTCKSYHKVITYYPIRNHTIQAKENPNFFFHSIIYFDIYFKDKLDDYDIGLRVKKGDPLAYKLREKRDIKNGITHYPRKYY